MKRITLLMAAIMIIGVASAAHYIAGYTENGLDGTDTNGKRVVLWNYFNGENLTSVIGPTGPSGASKVYMFDCEALTSGCSVGDILSLKILEDNDNRTGLNTVNITVTGAGYDTVMTNLTINSPPSVINSHPGDPGNVTGTVDFNCSATDLDSNLKTIYLYGNWSGWHLNDSSSISGGSDSAIFSKSLSEGVYEYYCRAEDESGIFSEDDPNNLFYVDTTDPVINSLTYNETTICGTSTVVRATCDASDAFTGVRNVSIDVNGTNQTATWLSGNDYYVDVLIDGYGNWSFDCYAQDWAGNIKGFSGNDLEPKGSSADLILQSIDFSNNDPMEDENVTVNATIYNDGCGAGNGVLIGLYDEDPDASGISLENKSFVISEGSTEVVSFFWTAEIGETNFFVWVDNNELFSETNESDNKLNKTLKVDSWQEFYGNVSADRVIGEGFSNMSFWSQAKPVSGNIFIVDKESNVDWVNLQAIGRTALGGISSGDLGEIDAAIGMTGYNDSVSVVYSGAPTKDFVVHGSSIYNVPIINSTTNSVFKTGILWDVSDDSNGEYNGEEDIIFVTEVNVSTVGTYGTYDYEINVPVKIRDLDPEDSTEIYFYYDLN